MTASGDVQSSDGRFEGSSPSGCCGSTSTVRLTAGGPVPPGITDWATAAVWTRAASDVISSEGSKISGSASDDMVPSVASSWDSGAPVSTVSGEIKVRTHRRAAKSQT